MKFAVSDECKWIRFFLEAWGQGHIDKLQGKKIRFGMCEWVASAIDLTRITLVKKLPKLADVDAHKIAAVRVHNLRSAIHLIILNDDDSPVASNELKELTDLMSVDVLVFSLRGCSVKDFYSSRTIPSRKRDLKYMFSYAAPPMLSLSMIGYYLERDFPKSSTISPLAPLLVQKQSDPQPVKEST